jgi:hypothetical protein
MISLFFYDVFGTVVILRRYAVTCQTFIKLGLNVLTLSLILTKFCENRNVALGEGE